MIIGSGPIVIGQACEFDYFGTQACRALRQVGYEIVLVNPSPATIMTDPGMADVTYIEPLNVERMTEIIAKERPDALLPNLGGRSALNLFSELAEAGVLKKYEVKVIGVQLDAIKRGEDRDAFKTTMEQLGIGMARSEVVTTVEDAERAAAEIGYPVVIRPAYTMGGTGCVFPPCRTLRRAAQASGVRALASVGRSPEQQLMPPPGALGRTGPTGHLRMGPLLQACRADQDVDRRATTRRVQVVRGGMVGRRCDPAYPAILAGLTYGSPSASGGTFPHTQRFSLG